MEFKQDVDEIYGNKTFLDMAKRENSMMQCDNRGKNKTDEINVNLEENIVCGAVSEQMNSEILTAIAKEQSGIQNESARKNKDEGSKA